MLKRLYVKPSEFSPEINLSHDEKIFLIQGNSRPEDVRDLYYPVVEWLSQYHDLLCQAGESFYSEEDPLTLRFDFGYFNSSSAKFLYDIINLMKSFSESGIPVSIKWYYNPEDIEMKEAGEDLGYLAETELSFIKKKVQ